MFDSEKKTDRKVITAPNSFDSSPLRPGVYAPSLEFFILGMLDNKICCASFQNWVLRKWQLLLLVSCKIDTILGENQSHIVERLTDSTNFLAIRGAISEVDLPAPVDLPQLTWWEMIFPHWALPKLQTCEQNKWLFFFEPLS